MLNLKEYRSKIKGLADLLNWAALIDSGVVLCKDGSLIAGWVYHGEDMGAASNYERNYQTAIVNDALSRLGSGWACWFDSARIPAPHYPAPDKSFFTDPITAAIDQERRLQFENKGSLFITEQVLIVQYKPPLRRNSKVVDYLYDDDQKETDVGLKLLKSFKQAIADLQGSLSTVLKMNRLESYSFINSEGKEIFRDHLVNYLSFCLCGDSTAINIPKYGAYLDSYIVNDEFWGGATPKIGDNFIYCIAVEGFPVESYPGLMDMLEGMAISFRWSSRFIFLDTHQAVNELNSYRKAWKMKSRGFFSQVFKTQGGSINEDALIMANEAQNALSQAEGGMVTFGYYTPVIILMGKDRDIVEDNAVKIINEMNRRSVRGRIETINAVEAYFGSLPAHTYQNVRRPIIHTLNLSDLLPLASVWAGKETCPCDYFPPNSPPLALAATTGSTPYRFNLHTGQLGHTLILGPTRSGKSSLIAFIVAQYKRYNNAKICCFDKGNSLFPLVNAINPRFGARHYEVGSENSQLAFAPLTDLETLADKLWAIEWVANCCILQMQNDVLPNEMKHIEQAIEQLVMAPKNERTITSFCSAVQAERIREAMAYYTLGNVAGHLLDADIDGLDNASLTVFEMEDLLRLDKKIILPVMIYLVRKFIKSLDGSPSMVVIDEAWTFFQDEFMRKLLEEWLRTLAKANCIVILATQSLADAINSGLVNVLIESTATKIYLPNMEAKNEANRKIYEQFGFSDVELDIISTARKQRQYYVVNEDGRRLIDFGFGDLTLSFVGAASKENINEIRKLIGQYGDDWVIEWTRQRNCSEILEDIYSEVKQSLKELSNV
ncbi:VirB4 family type IV secretion/conjugal transfer ATPase [Commensalibacter nepenthis]|uniref:Conjugal transfer protein TrbE n=1 Tax=Commensalibacter nepenthis TaxID=3043872 RepID=A0ABT6QAF6_9PROT|nr:hypothetical protein [Commensalibacter sp. TBRC 10068]MDI2113890.1 hypothetical protein [Commensalibacter sp. TBRC 10068]